MQNFERTIILMLVNITWIIVIVNLIYKINAIRSIEKIESEINAGIIRLLNFNFIFAFIIAGIISILAIIYLNMFSKN